jgi:imidazolonepropionase-like amidohydrolase
LKALNLMFSVKDIVKIIGPNSAAFVQMRNDIGTLETGKLADVVVLPQIRLMATGTFSMP